MGALHRELQLIKEKLNSFELVFKSSINEGGAVGGGGGGGGGGEGGGAGGEGAGGDTGDLSGNLSQRRKNERSLKQTFYDEEDEREKSTETPLQSHGGRFTHINLYCTFPEVEYLFRNDRGRNTKTFFFKIRVLQGSWFLLIDLYEFMYVRFDIFRVGNNFFCPPPQI